MSFTEVRSIAQSGRPSAKLAGTAIKVSQFSREPPVTASGRRLRDKVLPALCSQAGRFILEQPGYCRLIAGNKKRFESFFWQQPSTRL